MLGPVDIRKAIGKRRIVWPHSIDPPELDRHDPGTEEKFCQWAVNVLQVYGQSSYRATFNEILLNNLTEADEAAIVSCIRTYPMDKMSEEQIQASRSALIWCIDHWWYDTYHVAQSVDLDSKLPAIPLPNIHN